MSWFTEQEEPDHYCETCRKYIDLHDVNICDACGAEFCPAHIHSHECEEGGPSY